MDTTSGTINIYRMLSFIQTSLSESYNYRHLRTATNVSTIIHISTKTPARTRKNSPPHNFLHPTALPHPHLPKTHKKPPPPQLVATKGVVFYIARLEA